MSLKNSMTFGILTLAVCVSFSNLAYAGNWPEFRGPNGSGIGTGTPPEKWDIEKGENVKWKAAIPGLGNSSPVIWDQRVYLTTAVPLGGETKLDKGWMGGSIAPVEESGEWEWKVLALDRGSGKIVWEQTAHKGAPMFKRHPKSTHANGSPATDGKHIVAYFGSEGVYCFDAEGKLLWKKNLGPLNASWSTYTDMQWGTATSPIIYDGKVILQCDVANASFWISLDINDGKEVQRIERGDAATWTTPTVYSGKGDPQLVCNGYKKMAGYSLSTGKELWSMSDGGDIPVPRPVIAGDLFIITNSHSKSPIFAVKSGATGNITPKGEETSEGLAWSKPVKGSYMPTPIVIDDLLYVADDNGILTTYETATGKQVYRERLPGGGKATYSASPVSAGGRLYTTNEDGQVDVIKTGREYKHLASNQMKEQCMATPAIVDGMLFVRGQDNLYCIGN
ncbi:MAG: PQQ-binding-like beta-propeller repeat protein [Planctomycetes bacterium]|nr:PQQ-binding-like beta-propeller repeat protein [Planctomycetota bacterium]MBI3832874.1 PQQ-binding-like beta-propeller repeat protein [Planctomycetota bacterium]